MEYPENGYWIGYRISWVLLFIGCWIYCIAAYGFLLGVGLGWLPAFIVATLVSFLWPVAAALLALAIIALVYAFVNR